MRTVFPQDDEEELKAAFFADTGRGYFVEVGANDPLDPAHRHRQLVCAGRCAGRAGARRPLAVLQQVYLGAPFRRARFALRRVMAKPKPVGH
jgi:hypothetical protein